jgi:hypothetical protein
MIDAAALVSIAWTIHAILFLASAIVLARKANQQHQRILVWPAEDRWLVCAFMVCWSLICMDAVRLREQPMWMNHFVDHSLNNDLTVFLRYLPVPIAIILVGRIDRGFYLERAYNQFCRVTGLCKVRFRDGNPEGIQSVDSDRFPRYTNDE